MSFALSVVLTLGPESSQAQQGRFRGLKSSHSAGNGGGKSGFRFSMGKASKFNLSNHNSAIKMQHNSSQSFSRRFSTQKKMSGHISGIASQLNSPSGIRRSNPSRRKPVQFGHNKSATLRKVFANNKSLNTAGGTGSQPGGIDNRFNKRKFDHLKNVLQGKHGKSAGGQNLGHGHTGHGHTGKLMQLIRHNQKHGKICIGHQDWCHSKPQKCHWWYNWCKPLAYCAPEHHHYCTWNYVTCDDLANGRVVQADARWYLGLKGLLLPGQGVGLEEVTPGSPADSVGLQPGMVITRCNGIDLVDEAALARAISRSGGVLQMDLLLSEGTPATCVVVMQRVASVNF